MGYCPLNRGCPHNTGFTVDLINSNLINLQPDMTWNRDILKPAKFSFSEKSRIRVPLKELRTVPEHYLWFLLEGTPPINLTVMNTSTSLKGGLVIKGFQLNRTGTYQYTLLAENKEGSDSKTVEVTVVGKDSILLNFISM